VIAIFSDLRTIKPKQKLKTYSKKT